VGAFQGYQNNPFEITSSCILGTPDDAFAAARSGPLGKILSDRFFVWQIA
jgi:hypothetical protein